MAALGIDQEQPRCCITMSEPPAQPGHQQRVGGYSRLDMPYALYNLAVVAARSQLLGFGSREDMLAAKTKLVVVCAGHGRSL